MTTCSQLGCQTARVLSWLLALRKGRGSWDVALPSQVPTWTPVGWSRWGAQGGSLLTARTSLPQESQNLFCCLYRSWCHNPVTTVSLCFLTQNYRHAYDLIQKLYPSLSLLTLILAWR